MEWSPNKSGMEWNGVRISFNHEDVGSSPSKRGKKGSAANSPVVVVNPPPPESQSNSPVVVYPNANSPAVSTPIAALRHSLLKKRTTRSANSILFLQLSFSKFQSKIHFRATKYWFFKLCEECMFAVNFAPANTFSTS